jgi:hypothetical protein
MSTTAVKHTRCGRRARLLAFYALCAAPVLVFPGCACPHRQSETLHTLETYSGREDGLVAREEWRDAEGGGGFFLFADPTAQNMAAIHTNQTALGGGSAFTAGSMTSMVDTNLAPAIGAAGTATGNILGAAAKAAVK